MSCPPALSPHYRCLSVVFILYLILLFVIIHLNITIWPVEVDRPSYEMILFLSLVANVSSRLRHIFTCFLVKQLSKGFRQILKKHRKFKLMKTLTGQSYRIFVPHIVRKGLHSTSSDPSFNPHTQ